MVKNILVNLTEQIFFVKKKIQKIQEDQLNDETIKELKLFEIGF